MLLLSEEARTLLKKPFGTLYSDFFQIIPLLKSKFVCTVGDVVSKNAFNAGITPSIAVIDGITKRTESVEHEGIPVERITHHVQNKPGTISDELIEVLRDAMMHNPSIVLVDGEEDLAVLPLSEMLPQESIILYGQPNEGVVLCEVTPSLQRKTQNILSTFTINDAGIK